MWHRWEILWRGGLNFAFPTVDSEPQTVGKLFVMTRVMAVSLECSPKLCECYTCNTSPLVLAAIATARSLLFAMITNMSNQFIGIF